MYKEIVPPLTREEVYGVLRQNKITQTQLAAEYGRTQSAVSRYVNGLSESAPFWDWFFNRFPEARQCRRAS